MNDLRHTYSDAIFHKRIVIIGPTPPPLGGVSVHIKRVIAKLEQQNNTVYHINPEKLYRFNFLRIAPFKQCAQLWYLIKLCNIILYFRPHIIMYHAFCMRNSVPELMLLTKLKKIRLIIPFVLSLSKHKRGLSFRTNGPRIFLIEHDCRHLYQRTSKWKNWFSHYLKHTDQLICIGNITHQSYRDNGITVPQTVTIESAFLPPILAEEKAICATYPQELFTFLNTHTPIIVINAFQLTLWQGKDLYGIDQAIELIKSLKELYSDIGLVMVLGSMGDEHYYQVIMQRIQDYCLDTSVFIMQGQKELWPLLKYATVFIRPTLSDGYSVSIEEALYLGTPTVASDVCKRPANTVLYKVSDIVDFTEKTKAAIRLRFATT